VLGLFGVAVRFEPSVLRASAMAALALTATTLGVASSSVRLVGLAVTGLVLVDPLLVHRLGFQLSVAATVGIALWSRPLAERLRGPAFLREAMATSLAAQAAVAPLLLGLGGTSPVSIPANVLAVPAAGPVMVWGLTGGLVAGVVGGPLAALVHLPDRLILAWLTGVARVAASVPLRPVGAVALAATALLVVAAVVVVGRWRRVLVVAAIAVFVVPTAWPAGGTADGSSPATGVRLWRGDGTTVVVLSPGDPARVLAALQRERVDEVDLLAVDGTGPAVLAVVAAVLDRHDVTTVAGPPSVDVAHLVVLDDRHPARAGPFLLTADADHHITVTVTRT
jgi:competence protein ComEC